MKITTNIRIFKVGEYKILTNLFVLHYFMNEIDMIENI